MRTTKISFLAALLVVFSFAVVSCGSGEGESKASSPKEAADGFLSAMAAGDFAAAKEFSTDASAQALDMMEDMGDSWEGASYELGEVTEENGSATVAYSMDGEDMTLDLVEQDGAWKVEFEFMMPGEMPMDEEEMDAGEDMMDEEEMQGEETEADKPTEEHKIDREEGETKVKEEQKSPMGDESKMGGGN